MSQLVDFMGDHKDSLAEDKRIKKEYLIPPNEFQMIRYISLDLIPLANVRITC